MTIVALPCRRRRPREDRAIKVLTVLAEKLDEIATLMPGAQVNGDAFAVVFHELAEMARKGLQ
jgi:hypothetical protein